MIYTFVIKANAFTTIMQGLYYVLIVENQSGSEEIIPSYTWKEISAHSKWVFKYCHSLDKSFAPVFIIFSLISNLKIIGSIVIFGYMMQAIVNFSRQGLNSEVAWRAFAFYALYNIGDSLLTALEKDFVSRKKTKIELLLKRGLLHKLIVADPKQINLNLGTSTLTDLYTSTSAQYGYFALLIGFASNLITAAVLLVVITYFAYPLTIILLSLSIPRFILDKSMRRRYLKASKSAEKTTRKLKQLTTLWLSKPFVSQIFDQNLGNLFDTKFRDWNETYRRLTLRPHAQWQSTNQALDLVASLSTLVGFAWVLFKNASLSAVGSVYVQLRLINLLDSKLKTLITGYNTLEIGCSKIIDAQKAFMCADKQVVKPPEVQMASLTFKDVSYSQPDTGQELIAGLSLDITPGQKTQILHKDSLSREIIYRIISSQMTPSSGDVMINGIPVINKNVSLADHRILTVSGDSSYYPFLSVSENITLSPDSPDADKITTALTAMGIREEINKFPEGQNQTLSDLPIRPPADLIAKILAARAIYQQPGGVIWQTGKPVTSVGERSILSVLYKMPFTVIAVGQYFSSSQSADYVVLFIGSRIVDSGTVSHLMSSAGPYAAAMDRILNPPSPVSANQ